MPLSDSRIVSLIEEAEMITPAILKNIQDGKISSGLTSSGYDLCIANEFKLFQEFMPLRILAKKASDLPYYVLNPKSPNPDMLVDVTLGDDEVLILDPGRYAIGRSVERLKLPRNIMVIFIGKSTYARAGIFLNITPGESEWEGHLTIEIFNANTIPVAIFPFEGICQALFFKIDGEVLTSYADRQGKYQDQGPMPYLGMVKD